MIRVATFNAENLFARYRFRENFNPMNADGFTINNLAFDIYEETAKQITAKAIKEVNADVLALQEVESLGVLDAFNSRYMGGRKYKHRILIDAFDPRKIDVALMSRYPIVRLRTYRHERNDANTAARRSCARGCPGALSATMASGSSRWARTIRKRRITVRCTWT